MDLTHGEKNKLANTKQCDRYYCRGTHGKKVEPPTQSSRQMFIYRKVVMLGLYLKE